MPSNILAFLGLRFVHPYSNQTDWFQAPDAPAVLLEIYSHKRRCILGVASVHLAPCTCLTGLVCKREYFYTLIVHLMLLMSCRSLYSTPDPLLHATDERHLVCGV